MCLRERERQLGLGKLVKDAGVAGIPGSLTGCARVHIIIDKAGSLPRALSSAGCSSWDSKHIHLETH